MSHQRSSMARSIRNRCGGRGGEGKAGSVFDGCEWMGHFTSNDSRKTGRSVFNQETNRLLCFRSVSADGLEWLRR